MYCSWPSYMLSLLSISCWFQGKCEMKMTLKNFKKSWFKWNFIPLIITLNPHYFLGINSILFLNCTWNYIQCKILNDRRFDPFLFLQASQLLIRKNKVTQLWLFFSYCNAEWKLWFSTTRDLTTTLDIQVCAMA